MGIDGLLKRLEQPLLKLSLREGGFPDSEPEKHSVATGTAVDARRDAVACDGQARLRG
jgi:hypothetical protein